MKPEELNVMTDSELRIKAAELDGWVKLDAPEVIAGWMMHGTVECWWKKGDRLLEEPLDCLNDWGAAGELWEKLRDNGFEPMVSEDEESVEFYLIEDGGEEWHGDGTVEADTVPRAITKAFILAMEES